MKWLITWSTMYKDLHQVKQDPRSKEGIKIVNDYCILEIKLLDTLNCLRYSYFKCIACIGYLTRLWFANWYLSISTRRKLEKYYRSIWKKMTLFIRPFKQYSFVWTSAYAYECGCVVSHLSFNADLLTLHLA